jgi:SAM-dependent methyltransferase
VKAQPPAGDVTLDRRVVDVPGEALLELSFEVRLREICTWITVARPTGEAQTKPSRGVELPYDDGSFARVVCRRGLQLLPDRSQALEEMRRVLAPGGEIEVSVPGSIERSPPFADLAESLERHAGVRAAAAVRWLFCMPEPDDLRGVLAVAAFEDIQVEVVRTFDRFLAIDRFLTSSASEPRILPEIVKGRVLAELQRVLGQRVDRDGLRITTETIVGRAKRV